MENKWNERIDQFVQAQRENILRDIGRHFSVNRMLTKLK